MGTFINDIGTEYSDGEWASAAMFKILLSGSAPKVNAVYSGPRLLTIQPTNQPTNGQGENKTSLMEIKIISPKSTNHI